jgi:hypothetical protein
MTEQEGGLLSAEQVEKIKAIDNRRERDRLRKAAKAKSTKKTESGETVEKFWTRNRDIANQKQIAALLERQEYVFNLLSVMDDARLSRVSDEFLFPSEVDEDVKADIAEHGICEMEVMLLEFWKHPNVFTQLTQRNDATTTFARYGLVVAIPGHRLHEWQEWLASKQPKSQPPPTHATLRCVNSATCGDLGTSVLQSIADEYVEKGINYRCHNCIRSGKVAVRKVLGVEYGRDENLYDSFGRIKL